MGIIYSEGIVKKYSSFKELKSLCFLLQKNRTGVAFELEPCNTVEQSSLLVLYWEIGP